jgi:hypothetical protein
MPSPLNLLIHGLVFLNQNRDVRVEKFFKALAGDKGVQCQSGQGFERMSGTKKQGALAAPLSK